MSVYEWDGKVHVDEEVTLTIKVSAEAIEGTKKRLVELHPYELPEVLAIPIDVEQSHGPYVEWVKDKCSTDKHEK